VSFDLLGTVVVLPLLLFADLGKHAQGALLNGIITGPPQQSHGGIFRRVSEAKQQLADLQQLVS
jgi:hypothetical protein